MRRELKALVRLATPIATAQLGMMLLGSVDTAVVGRMGERQLAAVGLGNAVFFAVAIFGSGIMSGLDPLIAQALGAGRPEQARDDMWQGLWLAALCTVPLVLLAALGAWSLARVGIEPATAAEASVYVHARLPGLPSFLLFGVLRSYLQGVERTRPLVTAAVLANLLNLPLDWLLVFGDAGLLRLGLPACGVPALGVAGAGYVSSLVLVVQVVVAALAVRDIAARPSGRAPRLERMGLAMRVGFPSGLQRLAEVGVFSITGVVMARIGTLALAAHQIAMTLSATTFMVPMGISRAAAVRVGRAIGAGDRDGTRKAGIAAYILGTGFMALCAVVFVLFPGALSRVLTDQRVVIAAAVPLLGVAALFQVSDGAQVVGAGALRGAGDTKVPLVVNLIGHYGVGLPLGVWLAFRSGLGAVGMWWGLCAGLTVVAVVLLVRFVRLTREAVAPLDAADRAPDDPADRAAA